MEGSPSSLERPPAKIKYSGKQKRKTKMVNYTEDPSNSDSNEGEEAAEATGVVASPTETESRGPKKVDFHLPGPSPKRDRRNSEEVESVKRSPFHVKKATHCRSSSSISSLNRVAQQSAAASTSSSKKPISSTGSKTAKPNSKRGSTPDTEIDDNASIAESATSGGIIRRTEAERFEYFKNQPDCGTLEEHRVLCTKCQKFVNLGRKQKYTVRPWEVHRSRCDQMHPNAKSDEKHTPEPSDDGISAGATQDTPSEPIRRTEAERKALLDADYRAEIVEPDRVKCRKCERWIRLDTKRNYALWNWNRHQAACSDAVPSSRVATAERRLKIVNDAQAKTFDTRSVKCALCRVTVPLKGDGDYNLTSWDEHKSQCPPSLTNEVFDAPVDMMPVVNAQLEEPIPPQIVRPPASSASTENTLIASDASPSSSTQGIKRPREESELPVDDPDARPQNRPRSETYEPPQKEAPGPLGWFLQPFKAFVRGFREGLNTDPPS